jgi:DNA-binding transcriptional ArsR family regulator
VIIIAKKKTESKDVSQPHADIDKNNPEPARLIIISYLYVVKSADFVFLRNHTGLTDGNLSSHLSKLESTGYIDIEK